MQKKKKKKSKHASVLSAAFPALKEKQCLVSYWNKEIFGLQWFIFLIICCNIEGKGQRQEDPQQTVTKLTPLLIFPEL